MKKLIIYIALALALAIALCSCAGGGAGTVSELEFSSATNTPSSTPEPSVVRFKAVGDNLIHRSIYNQALSRGGDHYDFSYAYENVAAYFADADISMIDQETVIDPGNEPSDYPLFNSPPELGDHMLNIGFDVFNVANNHSLDKGASGLLRCLDYWRERKNATVIGAYKNAEDAMNIRTLTANGISFAFLAFTDSTNGLSVPDDSPVILVLGDDTDLLRSQMNKAKSIADIVIVNAHWGDEYSTVPSARQRFLAEQLVKWGADIIIGQHPHVIQPVEYYDGPNGRKVPVAFSLGNFISAQDMAATMVGGAIDITVTKDHAKQDTSVTSVKFMPVITHYDGYYQNIRNYLYDDYTADMAAAHGVNNFEKFSFDYIDSLLKDIIAPEFH